MSLFLLAASVWTVDAIMALQTIHDPQMAVAGDRIAYVTRRADLNSNRYQSSIWTTTRNQTPAALPNAHPTDASPRWSPDGRQLAFTSRRDGSTQIYVAPSRPVTSSETGIEFYRWSPNGAKIAYVAPTPYTAEQKRDRSAGRDMIVAGRSYRNSEITIVDIASGEKRSLAIPKHVLTFDWSPDGKRIVFSSQRNARGMERFHADLFEYDLGSNLIAELVTQPGQDLNPSYSPDGRYVVFHSQCGSLSYFGERAIGIVPSGGGSIRYLRFEGDVFSGGRNIWWSADGKELRLGAGKGTGAFLYSVNVSNGEARQMQAISDPAAFSLSADGGQVVTIRDSALLLNGKIVVDLKPKDMPEFRVETVRWKAKDGLVIEGVLRYPVGYRAGGVIPLLTLVHGGPTGVATEVFPAPKMYPTQAFLQAGFAVFEPNFRGSINYGAAFRTLTIQNQGVGDMDDVMSGIDALVERGIADPQRLGLMGWSYGGFLSSWMITRTNRFKAASLGGCSMDWVTHYGMAVGGEDGPPEVVQEYFGGKPWGRLEAYYRHSQRPHLQNIKTPSLLMRGERDLDNVGELYLALRELKVPVEFITYPREPHSIGEPAHQKDMMERNLEWFKRWINVL